MARRSAGIAERASAPVPDFRWTDAKRAEFLGELAESCNVKASCRAVGMTTGALYVLRQRDEAFAAEWRAALLAGYDRLEERLLRAAGAAPGSAGEPVDAQAEPGFDPELAMRLLDRHRRSIEKEQGNRTGPVTRATRAEAEAALHARLDAIERRRKTPK